LKKIFFLCAFLILFIKCGPQGPSILSNSTFPYIEPESHTYNQRNIIKFYKDENLFNDSCSIYFEEIDTSIISYYDRGIKLNKSKPKEYKIYEEMMDWFDLEKTDLYKYKSPKLFFATEFNTNFIKGFRYGNDRFLNVNLIKRSVLESYEIEFIKKELPSNPKKTLELRQPKNLSEFCKNFKLKHAEADFLVLNNGLDITLGTFDGYNPPIPPNSKKRACAIRIPRTIIDIKNAKVQVYFLDEENLFYDSPLTPIKDGMIDEFVNIGKAFNSTF
jgi:hypothetical protein